MLIIINFGANIRNKGNFTFLQQFEDFNFIPKMIVQIEAGSPNVDSMLFAH
jgi:hypothetical protein